MVPIIATTKITPSARRSSRILSHAVGIQGWQEAGVFIKLNAETIEMRPQLKSHVRRHRRVYLAVAQLV